ncbi:MAG: RNA polymerase factor sigma-54 [Lentisphaeria bacterium]|jgi:RNA polymerase sigma-54 factor|nr:RNA polymerase factor sigma-54 [Lentisphaeria bacterium]
MDYNLAQGASQTQEQTHVLSPQHLQALKALQAPVTELSASFADVLAENPLITTEDDEGEYDDLADANTDSDTIAQDEVPVESLDENRLDYDEELARILEDDDDWASVRRDDRDPDGDSEAEKRREYMFNSLAQEASLQEILMEQLGAEDCTPEVRRAAEEVIGNIDDDGFFRSIPAEIAQSVPCTLETAEAALRLVQTFDPPGIGASSLPECLLIQLERAGKKTERMAEFVNKHLEDLEHNRLPKIAKDMGVTVQEVKEMADELRRICDPRPASSLAHFRTEYCPVEVTVERGDDGFVVRPNREHEPRFLIPNRYMKMLDDPLTDQETRDYILKNLKGLMEIRKALADRESTIVRIARIIADQQYDFFEKGPEHLRPMTMRDVADRLGIHETTVSRAIANKYMATPAGTFRFRDFFTGGYQNTDGEDVSSSAVKEYIREAVKNENPAHPLSDQKIVEGLKKKGLDVARRTVAKYREELGIPSSQGRKQYT